MKSRSTGMPGTFDRIQTVFDASSPVKVAISHAIYRSLNVDITQGKAASDV